MATFLLRSRLIGADDISFGRYSLVYVNYLGATHSIAQVNASHIPILSQLYSIENLFDGSNVLNIYPVLVSATGNISTTGNLSADGTFSADGDATLGGTLILTGNATLNGTVTIPLLNTAGFVKNTVAGLLTGGNGLVITDIPSAAITGAAAFGASSSGTDTYQITLVPPITAYMGGQLFTFIPDTSNTGACTLNVDGIGDIPIKMISGSGLIDPYNNSILANQVSCVVFNSDYTNFILINPAVLPPQSTSSSSEVFTTTGVWTKPAGVNTVRVLMVGSGGGGGGASNGVGGGSGGGGGSMVVSTVDVSAVANVTVTINAPGTGGAGGGPGTPGTDGGDVTFGAFLTATGGTGGLAGAGTPGPGGLSAFYTEQTDSLSFDGYTGVAGGAGVGAKDGGAGGDSGSHRGEGGVGGTAGTPTGTDGGDYGAGGGGGYTSGALHFGGGDGGPGLCIVSW